MDRGGTWIDEIIEHTIENYDGRRIVLWGKFDVSDIIRKRLISDHQIQDVVYIDSDPGKQNDHTVYGTDYIEGKSADIFVVVPLVYYASIAELLHQYGYENETDYYYFCDCVKEQTANYYEDMHGNRIYGNYKGLHFAFSGYDNTIEIGENAEFENCRIYLHGGTHVVFGANGRMNQITLYVQEGCKEIHFGANANISCIFIDINKGAELYIGNNSNMVNVELVVEKDGMVKLGDDHVWAGGRITVGSRSTVQVGDAFSIGETCRIAVGNDATIIIGEDCMVAWQAIMCGTDGHAIFDKNTGEKLNDASKGKRKIILGDHVWIGGRATILYDTRIGDGSIIGAGSVVKGEVLPHCIYAGNPARLLRRNVVWREEDEPVTADNVHRDGSDRY